MVPEYKRKANIGIAIAIILWLVVGVVTYAIYDMQRSGYYSEKEIDLSGLFGLPALPFIYGCCYYSKAKGRHAAWGLLGFFTLLGLIILVCLKDRSNENNCAQREVTQAIGPERTSQN